MTHNHRSKSTAPVVGLMVAIVLIALTACGGKEQVIKEVPVEKQVVVEKQVLVEVPVEKEVVVEKVVVKEVEKQVVVEKEVVVVATAVPAQEGKYFFRNLDPNPTYGGKLTIASHGPPAHFELYASSSISNAGSQAVMVDNLVRRDIRDVQRFPVIPDLAYRWEISPDASTYTFFLREGVKFHNGSEMTAEDVKASFERIIFPPEGLVSTRADVFTAVDEINVVDKYTVEFNLGEIKSPEWMMPLFATAWHPVLSKAVLEEHGGDLRRIDNHGGATGPFRHISRSDESWNFEKNQDYWNPYTPYVDRLEIIWATAFSPEMSALLLGGLVDWAMFISPDAHQRALDDPNMSTITWSVDRPSWWLGFNTENKPFDDARVRRAVDLVIDKQRFLDVIGQFGVGLHGGDLFNHRSQYGTPLASLLKTLRYDSLKRDEAIVQAKDLMSEAGYADGVEGVRYLCRDAPNYLAICALVQASIKEHLNIDANIEIYQFSEATVVAQTGEFDLGLSTCANVHPDPAGYLRSCLSVKPDGTRADQNTYRWVNDEFNELVTEFEVELDTGKRVALAKQMEDIVRQEMPYTLSSASAWYWGYYNYVKGLPAVGGVLQHDIYRWDGVWLDK